MTRFFDVVCQMTNYIYATHIFITDLGVVEQPWPQLQYVQFTDTLDSNLTIWFNIVVRKKDYDLRHITIKNLVIAIIQHQTHLIQ